MADSARGKRTEKIPAAAAAKVPKKKGRKVKPKGFPKRPLSAYNWFFKEERKKVLNLDFQTMGKEISTRWKKTTKEERVRFEELAKEDAKRYRKEVQIYEEEQILKARRARETEEKTERTERKDMKEEAVFPQGMGIGIHGHSSFNPSATSLLAAATLRAMEEKNHPDAPQRISPRLGPMAAAGSIQEPNPFQNASTLDLARRQQMNQLALENEIQAMRYQSLRNQMALGSPLHSQQSHTGSQMETLLQLEQQRRQETMAIAALTGGRRDTEQFSQQSLFNEYMRRRQQEMAALNALTGSAPNTYSAGFGGTMFGNLPTSTLMQMSSTSQQPLQARTPSFGNDVRLSEFGLGQASVTRASLQQRDDRELPHSAATDHEGEVFFRSLGSPKSDNN